jgi:hypothetical protein
MKVNYRNISRLSLLFSLMFGVVFPEVTLQENFKNNNLDGWFVLSSPSDANLKVIKLS